MTHAREQIRNQVVTSLVAANIASGNIFASQLYPVGEDQLPAICVYTLMQESAISSVSSGGTVMEHKLELFINAYVKDNSNYDNKIDALMVEIEKTLQEDAMLQNMTTFIYPLSLDINLNGEGDKPVIIASQTFELVYRSLLNDPEIII